jgi:hypothetical protein
MASVKPGDYFCCSWGYDQTNIDYLVVVSVSPTGKTVSCRRARKLVLGEDHVHECTTPTVAYGNEFRMCVRETSCGETILKGSYPYIDDCPESKRSDVFLACKFGEGHYETKVGFGH